MKKALIFGVTGQDGSYLAEFLLDKGYEVHGVKRRGSLLNTARIDHIYQDPHESDLRFHLHYGDVTDAMSVTRILAEIRPDEIYNLAAMSHVKVSFELPEYTTDVNTLGPLRILEAMRLLGLQTTRFYQASTSEIFGNSGDETQNEQSPFRPCSPYGVSKLAAFWTVVNYRKAYGLFACNGILFNHESPRRGETFVSRKICKAVAAISNGNESPLYLGNLDAKRDWGHAKDYVRAMWAMLQANVSDDFVIATGRTESVRQFTLKAFAAAGIKIEFQGNGTDEQATVVSSTNVKVKVGAVVVKVDPNYYRPNEVHGLCGDASKAARELGWQPSIGLGELIEEMVSFELAQLKA